MSRNVNKYPYFLKAGKGAVRREIERSVNYVSLLVLLTGPWHLTKTPYPPLWKNHKTVTMPPTVEASPLWGPLKDRGYPATEQLLPLNIGRRLAILPYQRI